MRIDGGASNCVGAGPNTHSSKRACGKSASSAKAACWSDGCSVASPTVLVPATPAASTAPIFSSPGRKRAKPSRDAYPSSTPRSTVSGSLTVADSSPSSNRCTASRAGPAATSSTPKNRKKRRRKPGISRLPLDNPALSDHQPSGNAHNRLIFQGFSRCQKVATPKSFGLALLSFVSLAAVSAANADLTVRVDEPKRVGQKAVIKLTMRNTGKEKIECSRAEVFLLDDQGKVVGRGARWVIGGTKDKPGLSPDKETTFDFVVQIDRPF